MRFKELFTDDFKINSEKAGVIKIVRRCRNCSVRSEYVKFDTPSDYCFASFNYMRNLLKPDGFCELGDEYLRIMLSASLFAPLVFVSVEDGDIDIRKECSFISNRVRSIFYDEEIETRESVCYMIKHMCDMFTMFRENRIVYTSMYLSHGRCTVKDMVFLYMSVCQINSSTKSEILHNLALFTKISKDLKCYDKAYDFDRYYQKNDFFYLAGNDLRKGSKKPFTIYFMVGLPGAGKDTYISKYLKGIQSLSRDEIRKEIGIKGVKPQGTKREEDMVSRIMEERIIKNCNERVSFIINNTNLKKKYRDSFEKMILPYNPKISFIYIEAPSVDDNKARRDGQIEPKIIDRMFSEFDFPEPQEYNSIKIVRQRK